MSRGIGANLLMRNAKALQFSFKQRQIFLICRLETLRKFHSIIRLYLVYLERETLDQLLQEAHGRVGGLLLKCCDKAKTRTFINGCILVHFLALFLCISNNAGRGNDFDINLYLFSGEGCLLIGFWFICGLLGFDRLEPEASHAAVKTCDGSSIALLA